VKALSSSPSTIKKKKNRKLGVVGQVGRAPVMQAQSQQKKKKKRAGGMA
jgi:hypothetical protein